MVSCRRKAIVFACTSCWKRGSIVKRLIQHEYESARAEDKWLASTHLLEQRDQTIADLQKELERIRVEWDDMHEQNSCVLTAKAEPVSLLSATRLSTEPADDEVKSKLPRSWSSTDRESNTAQSLPEHSPDDHDDSGSGDESRSRNRTRGNRPHSPGFKELCTRVEKLSGRNDVCDFKLCLEDFEEASRDCDWNDHQWAQWFSWFITGPAKTTWYRTLSSTEKMSWKSVKKIYQG